MEKGENLVPMAQSAGFEKWYMVRSQKGLVGWIKASDVDETR
jgi:SH3-like domain-containing protein